MSGEREWQPFRRFLEALGLRRAFGTMNHIAPAGAPCRGPPETVLIGQEHRDVVLPSLRLCASARNKNPTPPSQIKVLYMRNQ
jgi:hypothetical protein